MIRAALVALICLAAPAAEAADPAKSLRPVARDGATGAQAVTVTQSGAIRPPQKTAVQKAAVDRGGLFSSLRPIFRSEAAQREGRKTQRLQRKGAVCGDVAIQGEPVGAIRGNIHRICFDKRLNGCAAFTHLRHSMPLAVVIDGC